MSPQRREIRSAYIEWAKLRSGARYNLAASDVLHFPLSELPVRIEDLEISGSSGYGYQPLLERLSAKASVPVENIVPSFPPRNIWAQKSDAFHGSSSPAFKWTRAKWNAASLHERV
jgi:hypothetical protein